jgi:hypothetical protein
MKIVLLCLIAFLFVSCATVGGALFSSSYLSTQSPRYAKAFEIREAADTFVIEYAFGFSKEDLPRLTRARFGYERYFASLDRKRLKLLCSADSMPVLRQQDLILEKYLSRKFESGRGIDFASLGCRESPTFKILDQAAYKAPAKVGVFTASLAADAGLIYLFPIAYPIIALVSAGIAAAIILPSLH